jgi:hypothetical protein
MNSIGLLILMTATAAAAPAVTPPPAAPSPAATAAAPPPAATAAPPPPATPPGPPPAPAPVRATAPSPAPPPAQHLPTTGNRFRLALTYVRVLREDGALANGNLETQAVGLNWTFPSSTYARTHLGLAEQWESSGPYSARGFRIDLISFGYPIRVVDAEVRLDIEPIVTPVRGEIMFVNGSGGGKFLRMEGGVGLELSATFRQWFLALQPLAIDFRYWVYSSARSQTGFSRVFPLRVAIGHEW